MSSMTTTVSRKARSRSGNRGPMRASIPRAKAVSVDMATPQPLAEDSPALTTRYSRTATVMPTIPAVTGRTVRRLSRSSPMSNSRRTSRPTTKKKNVIRPLFTQPTRSIVTPEPPSWTDNVVCQTAWYETPATFAQTSAAMVAASNTAALPLSVDRNRLSAVSRRQVQSVLPDAACVEEGGG